MVFLSFLLIIMNNLMQPEVILFSTPDIAPLAHNIQQKLVQILWDPIHHTSIDYDYFTDGAPKMIIPDSVRWKYAIILADLFNHIPNASGLTPSLNDKYMSTRGIVKTLKDFWADTINVVLPSFPYARDDKYDHNWCAETKKRKPNLANLAVTDMINDGANNIITVDLHNDATFNRTSNTKFINLSVGRMFRHVIETMWLDGNNVVLSGTDAGGKKKIEAISKDLHINHITTLKERDYTIDQKVEKVAVYGDCKDKDVILYDDMIDTGGTMIQSIREIKSHWARSIHVISTHAMLHGDSQKKLEQLHQEGIINSVSISDSIAHDNLPDRYHIISLDTLFANTLSSLLNNQDINYNNGLSLSQ